MKLAAGMVGFAIAGMLGAAITGAVLSWRYQKRVAAHTEARRHDG